MNRLRYLQNACLMMGMFLWAMPAWAVDSYRYLHVNIDTPWMIFVFLFFLVFAPMLLAVILYWRYALKKDEEAEEHDDKSDQDHA